MMKQSKPNHLSIQAVDWQNQLRALITQPNELFELLDLDPRYLAAAEKVSQPFPLRVPRAFVERMTPRNLADPLLRQVLPLGAEQASPPNFQSNPLAEDQFNPVPGLLHKYTSRVLITLAPSCAINCRYCFRREFPYQANGLNKTNWQQIIAYLQANPTINEVIFSGGDPLMLPDSALQTAIQHVESVSHIRRLRIHSRLPIVIPARINKSLTEQLVKTRLQTILVVHCNHPQEIDHSVEAALGNLSQQGITTLNQSVLLRQVNDDLDTLVTLSERLFAINVLPYYLHQLDRVRGSSHFAVAHERAQTLYRQLQASLPGFLVPKYVVEQPGEPNKTELSNPFTLS